MSLTPAEIIVKRIMLERPAISQSRLSVLSQIFLRDPDAQWGNDGRIHVYGIKETNPRKAVMKPIDTVVTPLEINQELQEMVPHFYEADQVEREMEIMQYAFIEKNIDCFAKYNLSHQAGLKAEVLTANAMNPLIFSIPENVETSWKKAALEVVDAVIKSLKKEKFISLSIDGKPKDPLISDNWKTGYWYCMYVKFHNVREKLLPPVSNRAVLEISSIWDSVINQKS